MTLKQSSLTSILATTFATTALALGAGTAIAADDMAEATLALVQPLVDYKIYVSDKALQLVNDTETFVNAIKANDLETARTLYAPTRMSYEAIEPIAELFSDLDVSIDARADDYEDRENDPNFTGFHRLEYILWEKQDDEKLDGYADRLLADVNDLNQRIAALTFPPEQVVGGAALLMEEVAATKISGEEDRYSHTDLWDFQGNLDGSRKIFTLMRPLLEADDPEFVAKVSTNFETTAATLAKYQSGDGFETYDKLAAPDRTMLAALVNTLAEDLSTLRGKLGLN